MAWPPAWPIDLASAPLRGDGMTDHHRNSTATSAPRRRVRNGSHASPLDSHLDSTNLGSLDFSQLQIDSSSSDSDFRSSRTSQKPGHNRSMSNPFPSLFSAKKKKKGCDQSPSGFGDSDSSSDDDNPTARAHHGHQKLGNGETAVGHGHRHSFATGPCITCGSLMRWARGVEAFRCSICLTVNDLVPGGKTAAAAAGNKQTQASSSSDTVVNPISVERTRMLAKQCLRSYLEAVLANVTVGSPDPKQPSQCSAPLDRGPPDHGKAARITADVSAPTTGNKQAREPPSRGPNYRTHSAGPNHQMLGGRPPRLARRTSNTPIPTVPITISSRPAAIDLASAHHSTPTTFKSAPKNNQDGTEAKKIFQSLEDDIIDHFLSINCLDSSFVPDHLKPSGSQRLFSYASSRCIPEGCSVSPPTARFPLLPELDFKAPAGSSAENGLRPTGSHGQVAPPHVKRAHQRQQSEGGNPSHAMSRPIHIDWPAVDEWYTTVINAGAAWTDVYDELVASGVCSPQPLVMLEQIESKILKGQEHAQRVLLKSIETVLKRPGRRIGELGDFRFLIIALANPLLQASCRPFAGKFQQEGSAQPLHTGPKLEAHRGTGPASGQHSVIIKRILGLISNSSNEWHSQVIACFSQFSTSRFMQTKDLVSGFLAYRLIRHNEKQEEAKPDFADGLVPKMPAGGGSAATLQAVLVQTSEFGSRSRQAKKPKQEAPKKIMHGDDWQIKAAARVMGLLFAANNAACSLRNPTKASVSRDNGHETDARGLLYGQILPTSDFYMTLLDNCDLVVDFEAWEQKKTKFAFCQYPFLLSIWSKIQILEHEARRQMKTKARDAFFDSIMTRRNYDQHFILNVRRDCLVEDSLTAVSEAVGSGGGDIKKGLRIIFKGEEGIDAGGLRKEWFLLLVREVFNPDHGMFLYDEESQYCYFNPGSFETSDQFFLIGVVLGLAIYNSTILDITLPPFAFRKLLMAAPTPTVGPAAALPRLPMIYTLADLGEYRPRLARGLQQLLEYEGDVETAFCLDFTISIERYGAVEQVPLCPDGQKRPVTNANRREYVDLYIRYLLDSAVSRQFEPFKRGFYTVCGCNALSLFRPEEIELLVRGSDEALDIDSLRLAATYDNWGSGSTPENEPTIRWFWEIFEEASARDQRKLLIFVTGSDRIPATGPASLSIRILCLGDDSGRYPTARTCFNTLTLYRYRSKERLQAKLWGAVNESEGFGLK